MELCIVFNPAAGRRRAIRRVERLRGLWGQQIEFWPTKYAGHAETLAFEAARSGFRIVAAAGGDGTVHEVANGLLRAARPEVAFAVLPIGSANDYAHSVENYFAAEHNGSPVTRRVDVGRVREPGGRERYFVCCLGLGFNGAVTLESRKLHHLQGMALYGLATLRALWFHYGCPPMELTIDDDVIPASPTLMLSVLAGRREGGFVMAPRARLDDGWLEFIHAGRLSRWEVLRLLPRMALAGPPAHHAKVRQGRCRRIHLRSHQPLIVHVDGEFFCRPEDRITQIDIQVVPGALPIVLGHPSLAI
jgi:diacylglycerol kinase (ATP)